ncbi:L,D-transpeptidase [Actinocorallia sp. A-T 12471]|uniref:L,D-transpeptidase n=1 Tax=Actinocorallia sp. A-T 12471 TaxID=3089813 RepID=UPI0029D1ED3A|nr:L,D-transpeptidase [Actinocorallia sp. A-T 12471]MDX6742054.1 L,D-transpeptidase [Actinocorallia sp. A-T 12471]
MRRIAMVGVGSVVLAASSVFGVGAVQAAPEPERAPTRKLFINDVTPRKGEKVGTGMPIMLRFSEKIRNRKKVERALKVTSEKSTVGAWFWTKSAAGLPLAIFRPKTAWKPNQKVTVTAKLKGLKGAGPGLVGSKNLKHTFRIGDDHVVKIVAKTYRAKAYRNGKLVRSWPISMGSGGEVVNGVDVLITTSGTHLVMAHSKLERMISPGKDPDDPGYYDEMIPWATRISGSGEYIHQNMNDPSCLGKRNCSHGCVRSPAKDAKWFMNWSYRGDRVIITGTKRKLAWNNGWGFHQMPWKKWVAGGALGTPVTT